MNKKQKILDLINSSKITEKEKEDWQKIINNFSVQELEMLHLVFSDDYKVLEFLTRNIQEKIQAFKYLDDSVLKSIIDDELNYLKLKTLI